MSEGTEGGEWWDSILSEKATNNRTFSGKPVTRSFLPEVVGGGYIAISLLIILLGMFSFWNHFEGGWYSGTYFESYVGGFFAILTSIFLISFGFFGVMAGVLIRKKEKIGIFMAWGSCLVMSLFTFGGMEIFILIICALWVGIPLFDPATELK